MQRNFEIGQIIQIREWDFLKNFLPPLSEMKPEDWKTKADIVRSHACKVFEVTEESLVDINGVTCFCPDNGMKYAHNLVDELLSAQECKEIDEEPIGVDEIKSIKRKNAILVKSLKLTHKLTSKAFYAECESTAFENVAKTKEFSKKILKGLSI